MSDSKKKKASLDDALVSFRETIAPINLVGLIVFLSIAGGIVFLLGYPPNRLLYERWADDDVLLGTIGLWLIDHLSCAPFFPSLPSKWNLGGYPYYVPVAVLISLPLGIIAKQIAAIFLVKPSKSILEDVDSGMRHYGAATPPLSHLEYILPLCPRYDHERLVSDLYIAGIDTKTPDVPESEVE